MAMKLLVYSYLQKQYSVTQTDPGHKGNTATNALKPAILETGLRFKFHCS